MKIAKKTKFARKSLAVALLATIQWNAVAYIQQQHTSSTFSFVTPRFSGAKPISTSQLPTATVPQRAEYGSSSLLMSSGGHGGSGHDEASVTATSVTFFSRLGNPFSSSAAEATAELPSVDSPSSAAQIENIRSSSTTLPPGLMGLQTVVRPLQDALQEVSADWLLSYADLRPDSSSTVAGRAFLATNLGYAAAGILLATQGGDLWFGFWTEVCSIASFLYHYTQLEARGETKAPTVQLAVLVDYMCALVALGTATVYLVTMLDQASIDIFVTSALSFGFLGLSWIYETGRAYMFFHSLWHILGAYSGLLIGLAHNNMGQAVAAPSIFSSWL